MTDVLPELSVSDADPETRAIYEAIMKHTGVGSPALIFRHFAVYPGFLQWVWKLVGPEVENGTIAPHALVNARSLKQINIGHVKASEFENLGVDRDAHRMIDNMLATYNTMNPVNYSLICGVRALLADERHAAGATEPLQPIDALPSENAGPLPPPLRLDEMRADVRDMVLSLSASIPSPGTQVIPTLYRHLAHWPDFLAHLAPALQAAIDRGDVEEQMAALTWKMQPLIGHVRRRAIARNPGPPPLSDKAAMIATIDSFMFVIPQLIVIGWALRGALPRADHPG